jgi:hypothetical protein
LFLRLIPSKSHCERSAVALTLDVT